MLTLNTAEDPSYHKVHLKLPLHWRTLPGPSGGVALFPFEERQERHCKSGAVSLFTPQSFLLARCSTLSRQMLFEKSLGRKDWDKNRASTWLIKSEISV